MENIEDRTIEAVKIRAQGNGLQAVKELVQIIEDMNNDFEARVEKLEKKVQRLEKGE